MLFINYLFFGLGDLCIMILFCWGGICDLLGGVCGGVCDCGCDCGCGCGLGCGVVSGEVFCCGGNVCCFGGIVVGFIFIGKVEDIY